MVAKNDITDIHKKLEYNSLTGEFRWIKSGRVAGYIREDGYKFIRFCGKLYRAHRLAWYFVYGYFPEKEIDHIDGNPRNNIISNLRECSSTQNKYNTKIRKDNTSGVKGIHWYKKYAKWQVNINYDKNRKCIGYFDNLFDACCAIFSARNKYHGEFMNHGNN